MTSVPKSATNRQNSEKLWEQARAVMPGGVSSPVRAFRAVGGTPVFIKKAQGPFVMDADGNRCLDLVGSWGPAIAGHAHPRVVEAVQKAAADGLSFGACCAAEAALAQKIIGAFPKGNVEMVRFVSSGTEATMSAVRLARGATGRSKILKFEGCYHGHGDSFLVAAGSGAATFGTPTSPGVPAEVARDTLTAPYDDLEAVRAIVKSAGDSLAAVIVEPVVGNMGFVRPAPGFLEGLRELCSGCGALLIFDEVMTGFRVAYGGYQNTCKIKPDLTCLGKVIGGGMPVAAYAGPKALMEKLSPLGPIYQAGTLSGNPLGMAAGVATLELCSASNFYTLLAERTRELAEGIKKMAEAAGVAVCTDFEGGMLGVSFTKTPIANFEDAKKGDHAQYAKFFHAMLGRGVWLPPSSYEAMFVSAAHTKDNIGSIISATRESFKEIA
jgi:glutamate-1-semialdehyde 2,1-aminomutase